MENNTVHTITLSGYIATTDGNCWALQLGTWDSYGIEQIQLKLGKEWAGLVITATFTPPKGRKAVKVVVDSSGLFDVPQEDTALSGQGTITFAGNTSGQQRISVDVPYVVANHAAVDGVTPDPTPSEWAQFVEQVQQARDDAEAAAQAAEGSNTAAASSASAAAESADKAAQSAQEAQNIVDGAVKYITAAKNEAVKEVNTAGETAVQEVQKAQSTGVQAVQTAQTEGVKAVNDAGDAKVEEIEQINSLLPKPTEADAGKVPVAQPDGSYQLGDAGNKIDDTVIAEDATWSSKETASRIYQMREVSGAIVCIDDALPKFPMKVTSESEVTRCGKNLLDMSTAHTNGYNITGFKNTLKPGVQYAFTVKSSGGIPFALFATTKADNPWDVDGQKNLTNEYVFEGSSKAFVAPDNIQDFAYLALAGGEAGIIGVFPNVEFQLEVGAEATNYEPYTGETFPAGEPIMPIDGVNTIFAASGGVTVGYASKVKAPINDAQITPLNTWSAQKLVDTLCPPFSVTGAAVQFSPVEGYPLSVQSTIAATQSGEGDPSPTNVRPIVPVNEAGIWWIDGDNVLNLNHVELGTFNTVNGEPTESATKYRTAYKVPCTKNSVLYQSNNKNLNVRVFVWNESGGFVASEAVVSGGSYTFTVDGYFAIVSGTGDFAADHYVGFSKTAAPYVGKDYTAQLPEPCYGGTVDLTDGKFSNAFGVTVVDGTTVKFTAVEAEGEDAFYNLTFHSSPNVDQHATDNILSSHFPYIVWGKNETYDFIYSTAKKMAPYFSNVDELNAYCQQQYTAGTPVTIAYPLSTAETVGIDPLTIPAPASPATAYSTSGEITVSGRSDPTVLIQQMQSRLAALESAQTGI